MSPTQAVETQLFEFLPLPPRMCISKKLESKARVGIKPRHSGRELDILTSRYNAHSLNLTAGGDGWQADGLIWVQTQSLSSCLTVPDSNGFIVYVRNTHCWNEDNETQNCC